MKFEHFALNVPDARASAKWYVDHLGMKVVRHLEEAPHTSFLADETGRIIIEFYTNTAAAIPDHRSAHPLSFHVAFVADHAQKIRARLESAGATLFKEDVLPDGTLLVMLRDPWGVPLQLCQRAKPF
jgi:catechol 2,3-dioxygenase-like lactoylglutathione lyase family enzyme